MEKKKKKTNFDSEQFQIGLPISTTLSDTY